MSRKKIKERVRVRDDERIEAYYNFGAIDYHSEISKKKKGGQRTFAYSLLRPFKLAALIWVEALKSLSSPRR